MTDILQATLSTTYTKESSNENASKEKHEEPTDNGRKRKLEIEHPYKCLKQDSSNEEQKYIPDDDKMLKKAKNVSS